MTMKATQQERLEQANALYERYGKPLETEHRGEYVAMSPDGNTILGAPLLLVLEQATAAFGPGDFIFKVGEKAVGKWRGFRIEKEPASWSSNQAVASARRTARPPRRPSRGRAGRGGRRANRRLRARPAARCAPRPVRRPCRP